MAEKKFKNIFPLVVKLTQSRFTFGKPKSFDKE